MATFKKSRWLLFTSLVIIILIFFEYINKQPIVVSRSIDIVIQRTKSTRLAFTTSNNPTHSPSTISMNHISVRKHNPIKHIGFAPQCKPLPTNILHYQQSFSKSFSPPNTTKIPSIPSLVLIAPPKTGTSTFMNTLARYPMIIQYGPERHYWNNHCNVNISQTEWKLFLKLYSLNHTTLSSLVQMLQTNYSLCNKQSYQNDWNTIDYTNHIFGGCWDKYIKQYCVLPNNTLNTNAEYYCYLIEKAPYYSKYPWIPVIYANLLPKVKLLNIIRNPMHHILSGIYAFDSKKVLVDFKSNVTMIKYDIIQELSSSLVFQNISDQCSVINKKWMLLQDLTPNARYLRMKRIVYRQFIVQFLFEKYVNLRIKKNDIFAWSVFIFPTILTSLFAYDERGINDNYKIIQFEWMFKNMAKTMKTIHCWLMEINHDQCNEIIDTYKNEQLFEMIPKHNHVVPDHDPSNENEYYQRNIIRLFEPCNTALLNIITDDRRDLLFGSWIPWMMNTRKQNFKMQRSEFIMQKQLDIF